MAKKRKVNIPKGSTLSEKDYRKFLENSYELMSRCGQYFAPDEDVNSLELAHLIPSVPESVLAIYVGINDAVCNKGLVTEFLIRHGHNNVFVFDPQVFSGGSNVPGGTADAKKILSGFQPPNKTWSSDWTYVMVEDPKRSFESLWKEKGYIDMIPAKFEDFTMLSETSESKVCFFVNPKAFEHPVNKARPYLKQAKKLGEKLYRQFMIPDGLKGETYNLEPVILEIGQKLYIATTDFSPCDHAWSNIHPQNQNLAVVNENSAVPLDLVIAKPPICEKYRKKLLPPKGSADMTTDWFNKGNLVSRQPLLESLFKG
jgi:hypothetical protein